MFKGFPRISTICTGYLEELLRNFMGFLIFQGTTKISNLKIFQSILKKITEWEIFHGISEVPKKM